MCILEETLMETHNEPAKSGNNLECKIAVILRQDLELWQRLNVTAFTVSGIAAQPGIVGAIYNDASGHEYFPMFNEPVMVYGADAAEIKRTAERARSRDVRFSIFTEELFTTYNDADNRAAVGKIKTDDLALVGMALRCDRKTMDKILKGLKLLR